MYHHKPALCVTHVLTHMQSSDVYSMVQSCTIYAIYLLYNRRLVNYIICVSNMSVSRPSEVCQTMLQVKRGVPMRGIMKLAAALWIRYIFSSLIPHFTSHLPPHLVLDSVGAPDIQIQGSKCTRIPSCKFPAILRKHVCTQMYKVCAPLSSLSLLFSNILK